MRERFKVYGKGPAEGYKIDRLLFRIVFFVIIGYLIFVVVNDGVHLTNELYVTCPDDVIGGRCYNPLFNTSCDEYYCDLETIPAGTTYGTPPSQYFKAAPYVALLGFFGFLVFNHIKNNWGYFRERDSYKDEN